MESSFASCGLNVSRGVHLKAWWIFTTNDMVADGGIVASGIAVILFKSPLPDLLIGIFVVGIVLKGGWEILKQASEARRGTDSSPTERGSRALGV